MDRTNLAPVRLIRLLRIGVALIVGFGLANRSIALEIVRPPASQTIFLGDPVSFRVEAQGQPPLQYRWLRNGKPIADIVPVVPDLPSWKRRQAQPLLLDGVALSRLVLEERGGSL